MSWDNCPYHYYGQAVNFKHRASSHLRTMRSEKHKNPRVQSVFNKYGDPKIEIIVYCSIEDLDRMEQIFLDTYHGMPFCLNIDPIASSRKGYLPSEDQKRKQSESMTGRFIGDKNPYYGMSHSEDTIKKMKLAWTKRSKRVTNSCILLNNETGIFYESMVDASRSIGMNVKTFRNYFSSNPRGKYAKSFSFIKV
jgi:group I intron endonuclease